MNARADVSHCYQPQDMLPLGFQGDCVNVRSGYMRNWLYPKRIAVYATPSNIDSLALSEKVILRYC